MQSELASDPIHGSLGPPPVKRELKTPEAFQEEDLKARKPIPWTVDENEIPSTMDSLKSAEKILNHKFVIPSKPEKITEAENIPYHFNTDVDDDVVSTLGNALYAEKEIYS